MNERLEEIGDDASHATFVGERVSVVIDEDSGVVFDVGTGFVYLIFRSV